MESNPPTVACACGHAFHEHERYVRGPLGGVSLGCDACPCPAYEEACPAYEEDVEQLALFELDARHELGDTT